MSNLTITNNELNSVVLFEDEYKDGLLTFAGAGTVLEGTILALDSSTLKYIPFVKGGSTNDNGIPKAVVTYDVVAAGAGDVAIRLLIGGQVRKDRLVIHADGDDSNVDEKVIEQLRDYGIVAKSVQQLSILDNQ